MLVTVLALVTALVLFALRQNINLFYAPTELLKSDVNKNRVIKLGGMVVQGSVTREDIVVKFQVTDYLNTINVEYSGSLPTLFREQQAVVAFGKLNNNNVFKAEKILAKHDENYMPLEVKNSLRLKKG